MHNLDEEGNHEMRITMKRGLGGNKEGHVHNLVFNLKVPLITLSVATVTNRKSAGRNSGQYGRLCKIASTRKIDLFV